MSCGSEARPALRSLLAESYLISQRDANALKYKYRAWLPGGSLTRWGTILDFTCWTVPRLDLTTNYRKIKYLDGICVDGKSRSPAAAVERASGARIRITEKDATLLHLSELTGTHHFRAQLAAAARYIDANQKLRATEFVAGVTYKELGRFATAFGFREMEVTELDGDYERGIRAAHMAFCAVNGKTSEFCPTVVFLPTTEFVQTFGTPS